MAASPIIQWNACLQAGDNVTLLEKGAELAEASELLPSQPEKTSCLLQSVR